MSMHAMADQFDYCEECGKKRKIDDMHFGISINGRFICNECQDEYFKE